MNATKIEQRSAKIKGLIVSSCLTQEGIANALRVTRKRLSQCLNINPKTGDFTLKDPYVREGISRHLKLPFQAVWGENPGYPNDNLRRSPFFTESSQSI